jgi:membrane protein
MPHTKKETSAKIKKQPPPAAGPERGRKIRRPRDFSKKGWSKVASEVKNQIGDDNITIVAAGVAFYAFLAIFPAIAATISIYALAFDAQAIQQQLSQIAQFLPTQTQQLVNQQLSQIAGRSGQALGWGAGVSILIALWSANKGMKALFRGVEIAYNQQENRGFIKENAITLLATFCAVILVIASMTLVIALPATLANFQFPAAISTLLRWGRWPVLGLVILFSLALLYRYAPLRQAPKWRWVTWGSTIATVLWLAGSWAFSFYVSRFGSYNATYGSVAAVAILLLWFMLSSLAILLGAEINASMEKYSNQGEAG